MKTCFLAAAALIAGISAAPADAQSDGPRFCPNRPGLGSSTCTTGEGHVSVEIGALGWSLDESDNMRSDSVSIGDSFLRYGIDDKTEVQVGFTAYTHNYNRVGSMITENGGFSDVRLGVRRNLIGNDGGNIALAIEPYVTVPVGASSVSAGDWSTGVVIPSSFSLGSGLSFGATGILAAAVDSDGDGRHFAATQYLGLSQSVSDTVGVTGEVGLSYDNDPSGDVWAPVASVSAAWTPKPLLQFDAGTVVALDSDSPDLQLYIGVSKLF
ncbi:transporter [Novosphingopyxis iocasae]|uniref:transporter n=1 Tax=Novosphingopyxis iocasae TaxID=2762729 RepID=UPI001650EE9E|nr:transporter [Novosphingopyxis iocasae]